MPQYNFGNLESPLSGAAFINTHVEPWRDALHSGHSGTSRPSYAVPGMQWINTTTNPWVLNVFDGTDDVKLGDIDISTNVFTPVAGGQLLASNNLSDVANTSTALTNLGALPIAGGSMTGAINEKLSTRASASSPNIWTGVGNVISYTGTTDTTGFPVAPQAGARRTLICAGAVKFVNGANMLIDGAADFTSVAGDRVEVTALTTTQFRLRPVKADGAALVSTSSGTKVGKSATQAVGALTSISFNTEEYDDGNWHDNTTNNSRITVDFTGRVNIQGILDGVIAAGSYTNAFIYKNGAKVGGTTLYAAGAQNPFSCNVSGDFTCVPGDYFELYAVSGAGWTLSTLSTFSVRRIK